MRPALARTKIGRFELLHRFAIGGMGEIFLARERGVAGFDRQVVVKLLIPELAEQPDLVTLFIDEARIAANLAHPNIVQIFDFGRDDGSYFLAMEYVPGQNLARLCARAVRDPRGLFTRELAVHVVAEMARGLDHAHRAKDADGKPLGIVHRDVSPHNLLLSIHGDVKVMDFGIAKAANTLHRTATGVIRGKYGYMSPEQLAGEDLDLTTDVYSAGIVLWELTLMRRLWPGADELAVLDQARSGKVPRPTEIDPSYPRDLEEIVMHAIARDRGQRTASAGALAADLRGWLALQGAVIDRAALGAVVTTLFPEIDHEMPFRPDPDPDPRTASLPKAPEPPPEPSRADRDDHPGRASARPSALAATAAARLAARRGDRRHGARGDRWRGTGGVVAARR
ncbi:MAG: serine/threonine protein kinase [Myxococcales bacterium]|nr:serine/threonine protein kinase [Myxococcales bacterium]